MENKFKELVDASGLTLTEVANELGIVRSTISELYNGKRNYCIGHLNPICNYFKVTPNYLLGYSEESTEELKAHYEAKVAELEDTCERRIKGLLKSFEKTSDLMEKEIDKKDLEIKLLKDIVLKQAFLLGGNINGITEKEDS